MLPKRIQELEGFGTKNVLLISGVALVLFVFAISQKPFHFAQVDQIAKAPAPIAVNSSDSSTTSRNGAVLGAVSIDPNLAEIFRDISVNTSSDNSAPALKNYGEQINIVAENNNLRAILNMPKGDTANAAQNKFFTNLESITVPETLADYHRLLLGYYGLRFAKINGTASENVSSSDIDTIISSLQTQLNNLKESYKSSGINLLATE